MEWENLLYNLLQIGLTVSVTALIPVMLRRLLKKRYPARAMCLVWAVLAIRLLIPVQVTLPEPPVDVTVQMQVSLPDAVVQTAPLPAATTPVQAAPKALQPARLPEQLNLVSGPPAQKTFPLGFVLFITWALGAVLCLSFQFYWYGRYRLLLRQTGKPVEDPVLLTVLAEQKQALGIRREIPLLTSTEAECPMLAGFFRPALYLPDALLSENDAGFIFRHELTHYRRHDLWLKLLLVLAGAVQWFNPLIHFIAKFAREDIELACDDAVVKGMDNAQRRAYGETILKSAVTAARRRALISCFTGEKETLMRRLEGLFDRSVKKRGIALVLVMALTLLSVGAAFTVGGEQNTLTSAELVELGSQWMSGHYRDAEPWYHMLTGELAQKLYDRLAASAGSTGQAMWQIGVSSPSVSQFTVLPDEKGQWATIVTEWSISGSYPTRQAERIHFVNINGEWKVDQAEGNAYINDTPYIDTVDSAEDFRILYENDLGLPDWLAGQPQTSDDTGETKIEPINRLKECLHLEAEAYTGGTGDAWFEGFSPFGPNSTDAKKDDIQLYTVSFDDQSELRILMVRQYDDGWLPQDWINVDNHANNRTAADLAGQFARGVRYKSGQFVYPILSKELREKFITYQQHGSEEWYWKLGGSSPSYRDFVLVPTDDPNAYTVVFQRYGGGINDDRVAYTVVTGKEDGRTVITDVAQCSTKEYTQSELFALYYDTGLTWPDLNYGGYGEKINAGTGSSYNGLPLDNLWNPDTAAATVFGDFGEWVTKPTEEGSNTTMQEYFTVALSASQLQTDATVRLTFRDGSDEAVVQMHKDATGYWLPTGLVNSAKNENNENGINAALDVTAQIGSEQIKLPVGALAADIMRNKNKDENDENTEIPALPLGTPLVLTPLAGTVPDGTVITVEDAVLREDGSAMFGSKLSEVTELKTEQGKALYSIPYNWAIALLSTIGTTEYRGLTISYQLDGQKYTATAVFSRWQSEDYSVQILSENTYTDRYLGYTLTLPDSFVHQGFVRQDVAQHAAVNQPVDPQFGMVGADPFITEPGGTGNIMRLNSSPTELLIANHGENWENEYPVFCKKLAEHNGMTYFLTFASDVQYDPSNKQIAEIYSKMFQDAQKMDETSITFPDDPDGTYRKQELFNYLYYLGERHASAFDEENADKPWISFAHQVASINTEKRVVDILHVLRDPETLFEVRRIEQATFGETGIDPIQTATSSDAASDTKGTTLERFKRLYYDSQLGLVPYATNEVIQLQRLQQNGKGSDLSTPEKGALCYAMSEAYASHAGTKQTSDATAEVTYQFWDTADISKMKPSKDTVTFYMRKLQLDTSLPAVWLPEGFSLVYRDPDNENGGLIGLESRIDISYEQYYAYLSYLYPQRTTEELLQYLKWGWIDTLSTGSAFTVLEQRYAEDPAAFNQLLDRIGQETDTEHETLRDIRSLWKMYLENPYTDPTRAPSATQPAYTNSTFGYTLALPDWWQDRFVTVSREGDRAIEFYMKEVYQEEATPSSTGYLGTFYVANFDENMQKICRNGWKQDTTQFDPLAIWGGQVLYAQYATSDTVVPKEETLQREYQQMLSDIRYLDNYYIVIQNRKPRFSEQEIQKAYQAVRDYATAHGFSVGNLRFNIQTELGWSLGIMTNGVLQGKGLSVENVITVAGDAAFGEGSWTPFANGWSFTLYRENQNGGWILLDGAYGY